MKHDALGAMLLVMAVALTLTLIAIPGVDDDPTDLAARVAEAPVPPTTTTTESAAAPLTRSVDETAETSAATTDTVATAKSAPVKKEQSTSPLVAPGTDITTGSAPAEPVTTPATDVLAEQQANRPGEMATADPTASEPPSTTADTGANISISRAESTTNAAAESAVATEADSSKPLQVATAGAVAAEPVTAEPAPDSAGAMLFAEHCAQCHDGGQAPRLGDQRDWVNRFARGMDALKQFVIEDQVHAAVAGALSREQLSQTLAYMMAATFWPQSR